MRLVLPIIMTLAACAPGLRYPGPLGSLGEVPNAAPTAARAADQGDGDDVAKAAAYYLGRNPLVFGGETFRYDCSGLVEVCFARAGVPFAGNTQALFDQAVELGVHHRRKRPFPGDVAFFDDTYDRNDNGRLDDPLSHIAVVESVDSDGTITLVHKGGKGVVRIYMNLLQPDVHSADGRVLNSWLRAETSDDPWGTEHYTGELWRGFASFWAAEAEGLVAAD